MSALVTVAFACNDDHGNDRGRSEAVNFVSDEHGNVDLCCQMPGGQVVRQPFLGKVTVGRRRFKAQGWLEWYGNMAWNATGMTLPEAERLLRYLLDCGYTVEGYDCDGPFAAIIEKREGADSTVPKPALLVRAKHDRVHEEVGRSRAARVSAASRVSNTAQSDLQPADATETVERDFMKAGEP